MGKKKSKKARKKAQESNYWQGALGALLILVFILYWPALDNPLVYDSEFLLGNDFYREMLSGFSIWQRRWVGHFTFALTHKFFADQVEVHRLINVLLHVANVFLIFKWLKTVFESFFSKVQSKEYAFWAASLFALNPMALFATAYLIQRLVLFATFFALLSLYSFTKGLLRENNRWFAVSALFYFLALHSKEQAIMMPAVAVVLLVCFDKLNFEFFKKHGWVFVLYLVPALQVFLLSKGILGQVYEPHAKTLVSGQIMRGQENVTTPEGLYALSVVNQGYAFFKYLLLWVIPVPIWIAFDIQFPFPKSFFSVYHLGGFLGFCAYGAFAIYCLFKEDSLKRLIALALLYPFLFFMSELSVVRYSENFVIYRSYLWMVGFFALVPLVFEWLGKQKARLVVVTMVVFSILILKHRMKPFESVVSLWQDSVDKLTADAEDVPGSYRLYDLLGYAYLKNNDPLAAEKPLKKSIELNPNYVFSHHNMGVLMERLSDFEKAREFYLKALYLRYQGDKQSEGYKKEGAETLGHLGSGLIKAGLLEKAVEFFRQALSLDPTAEKALNGMIVYLESKGDQEQVLAYYRKVLDSHPNSQVALINYGQTLYKKGDYAQALAYFEKAQKNNLKSAKLFYHLGNTYSRLNRPRDAVAAFKESEKLDDRSAEVNLNMASNLLRLGQVQAAKEQLQKALFKKPDYLKAKNALEALSKEK